MINGKYSWSPSNVKKAWRTAERLFREALFESNPKPERVVLLMGIPAAGKTTWISHNEMPNRVYFDATLDSPGKRRPWIRLAEQAGVKCELVYVQTPLEVCLERNIRRSKERRVPDETMRRMAKNMADSPPSVREGFTAVHFV
jgi:predicted kinase